MSNNHKYGKKKHNHNDFDNYVPPFDATLLATPLENLGLSEELCTKLKSANINTYLDVAKRTEQDFYRVNTFNKKNLFELKDAVKHNNFGFKPLPERKPEEAKTAEKGGEVGKENPQQNKGERPNKFGDKKHDDRKNVGGQKDEKFDRHKKDNRPEDGRKANPNHTDSLEDRRKDGKKDDFRRDNKNNNQQDHNKSANPNGKNEHGNKQFDNSVSEAKTKAEHEKLRPKREEVPAVHDAYVKLNRNGKWGFADRNGKEVISPLFDDVFNFKEDLCCVEQDEKFGYIDRKGDIVIPIEYECAQSFSEGYACVYKNGNCGYINKQNEVVVEFRFDAGTMVVDGNCRVKRDGKWGELFINNPSEIRWIV